MDKQDTREKEIEIIMIVSRLEDPPQEDQADDRLVLSYDQRRKCRQRVRLQSGQEAGLLLPRGTVLRNGDRLVSENGVRIAVQAAPEKVSIAQIDDALGLARIAYHLGNRHAAVQVMADRLIYRHDHVLDEMVHGLGGAVTAATRPFEPEEGAYHGSGHAHSH